MTQFEKTSANLYNTTVFVGGIPGNISQSQLSAYFTQFGKINHIELPVKKSTESVNSGYCYVTFASQASKNAVLRIRDHLIGSRRVTCKHYLNGSHLSAEIQSSNERKLFVKFIPGWVTENDFKAYFEQFGTLESYYMVKYRDPSTPENKSSSSVGYLVYQDRAISDRILAQRVFKIGNKKMQVSKYDRNYIRIPNKEVQMPQKTPEMFPMEVNHNLKPTQVMYSKIRQTKTTNLQASSSSTSLEKILPERDHEVNYRFNHLVQYQKHPISRIAGFASSPQPRNCSSELIISLVKEDMVLSASLSDAPTLRHSSGMSLGTTPTNTAARKILNEAKVGPCQ